MPKKAYTPLTESISNTAKVRNYCTFAKKSFIYLFCFGIRHNFAEDRKNALRCLKGETDKDSPRSILKRYVYEKNTTSSPAPYYN